MIALLTGGAGVVGKALCRELIARGVCVRVLTLPGDSLAKSLPSEVDVRYGDVTDFDSIRDAFENVDVVYHLAAILLSTKRGAFEHVNTWGTRNVLEACKLAGVRRFLYVSSISVTYPVLTPYGESKKKGEALVQSSGLDWTIVRPTLVIGDGGGVEFNMFRDYVKRFPVYFMPGGGKCFKRPVRSVDLVRRNDCRDDLDLTAECLVEQGPHGSVDQAADKNLLVLGFCFPLEESSGDFSGCIIFLVVLN